MTSATERRPPQVTFSSWLVVGGSVVVVLGAFEAMSGLRTLETREAIERFIAEPPGSGLGLGFEGARELRRVSILVLATCATAAAILGFFALRRDRVARIALSVLALPIFLAGSIAGGFASAVVTVSIVMLWLEPARSWFAGRPLPERFRLPSEGGAGAARRQDRDAPRPPDRGSDPQPGQGPGQPYAGPGAPQQPWGPPQPGQSGQHGGQHGGQQPQPYHGFGAPGAQPWAAQGRPGDPRGAAPADRPRSVLMACVVTWIASGLVSLVLLLQVVAVVLDPDLILDEVRRTQPSLVDQGMTTELLVGSAVVTSVVGLLWCVSAVVIAVFALRRHNWARVLLAVSAGVAAGLTLVMSVVAPYLLVVVVAGVATVVGLTRPETGRWYAAGRSPR
ncbi:hypothetical protein RDV89_19710 [Nocardioides zeae]|uniref:DUF4064 domain-containing protein n=1 Tax=Nocardioides imazamoxiresistens TaxID=3231893 RepID=A0ABU3Q1V6_9ACTN|nr:hypothetical protein [Nocardioides zeae]MDT9595324.1 hypothetical protein [Nocardioides zeae]